MKCTSCQAEEQTPEIILRKLIEVYGKELLQQEQRLSGMISDLFAQDKRTKKMLLLSVKEQVPQQIYAITNNNEREIRLSAIQLHMQEEVFLNEEIAVQIISIWRNVFDRKDPDDSYEIVWRRGFCGFRNSIGEMVTPYKYDDANPFKDNLALVVLDEKYGYIDKKGNEVIPLKFYRAVSFSEGLAAVKLNWNSKWGYINCQGKEVIFSDYDKIGSFIDGLAKVEKHYKTGFINNSGNIIIPLKYNNVSLFSEGLVGVRNDSDRCGFINKDGEEIIPCIFDTAYSFSDDFALVQVVTKWGFIDKQNYVVIAFQYIDAMSFNKGLAPVRSKEYKWGLINKKGELVLPYKYNSFG